MSVLNVIGLRKILGAQELLRGADLRIERGEVRVYVPEDGMGLHGGDGVGAAGAHGAESIRRASISAGRGGPSCDRRSGCHRDGPDARAGP